jgi:hypothetical protein
MVVESVALGLRGIAAITDLPTALGSWPAICTTMPLAPAIDPNTMKASANPALRCKLGDRKQSTSECVLYAEARPVHLALSSLPAHSGCYEHR